MARLEAHIEHIVSDLREIKDILKTNTSTTADMRVDIATLKSEVSHKPSRAFIVSVVLSALAVLGALSVFHERIIHLIG